VWRRQAGKESDARTATHVRSQGRMDWFMSSLHCSIHVVSPVGPARPRPWECGRTAGTALLPVQRARNSLAITALAWVLAASPSLAIDESSAHGALSLVNRSVTQDQGSWVVDYRLRYTGKTGVIVTPEKVVVKVEGWVSNSRVPSHAIPRWSSLVVSHGHDLSAVSEVVGVHRYSYGEIAASDLA
jgi:hypothetical protein